MVRALISLVFVVLGPGEASEGEAQSLRGSCCPCWSAHCCGTRGVSCWLAPHSGLLLGENQFTPVTC